MSSLKSSWEFIDDQGTFELIAPDKTSYLYFPLVNEALMMSSITPRLNGDIKIDQHHYLMPPVSVFDLHNSRSARNFFVRIGDRLWSAAGNCAAQEPGEDETVLQAGLLWHKMTRKNSTLGIQAEVTNFVPQTEDQVELMRVKITNISDQEMVITPIAAIPLYGRSADSLRDHRHVTALLNRTSHHANGVILKPVLSFDERGHNENTVEYAVLGSDEQGQGPEMIYSDVDSFIGEGGTLDRPQIDLRSQEDKPIGSGSAEAFGGLQFQEVKLAAGESRTYQLVLAIGEQLEPAALIENYAFVEGFDSFFQKNQAYWAEKLDKVRVYTGDQRRDGWFRWVSVQPVLRRLMGNSFLPYHDYGRGGRGWRDLWQDALGLLLMESEEIAEMLYAYFAGVRIDGSNATIIGSAPGEFKADRNNIPRVWMDHGAWPLKTLDFYFALSGDYEFLLRDQTYFKDHLSHRAACRDERWDGSQSNVLRTAAGDIYKGSIFEHLLVQHLTAFFNVGQFNNILLEGGDWNDGLDMAREKGESAAFTAFYAGNLRSIAGYAEKLISLGMKEIRISYELALLMDRIFEKVDYAKPKLKQARLLAYFDNVVHHISDKKIMVQLESLRQDLLEKSDWLVSHLRDNEWLGEGDLGWFNGYYDNRGTRVEGVFGDEVRMTLTGQVFPIMSGVATAEQIEKIIQAVDQHLYEKKVGGYRLNTDFKEIQMALGRAFGFAYGHKENGAMFSHMAMMYAYALYHRGYPEAGHRVLEDVYQHCQDFEVSKMYPGIPEYIGPEGRGYYFYLTGSASWYLFTMITQVFGVRGQDGDLLLNPKLMPAQFDEKGLASIRSHFAGREFIFEFCNPQQNSAQDYNVVQIKLDEKEIDFVETENGAVVSREILSRLPMGELYKITINLAA